MMEPIRVGIQEEKFEEDGPLTPYSILDELREELSEDVEVELVRLPVPMRENIRIVYKPQFDLDDLKRWRRACREKMHKADSDIDQKKFLYMVLAQNCVGIQLKSRKTGEWTDITDPKTGAPWTFNTPALAGYLKLAAGGWYACVEKMYSNDGHVTMTAKAVMDAAGYGDYDVESGEEGPLDF